MSQYIPPYKLSKKVGATASKTTELEGISAFLSRINSARAEQDRREDLEMQAKVSRGEISIDEQIQYNRDRQKRYTPDSAEYAQLEKNIADLEVSKKWEEYRTMQSNAVERTSQRAYLQSWLDTVEPDSQLAVQLGQEIGTLLVQIARDDYDRAYQERRTMFEQGQISRTNLISFLNSQLSATTDEDLRSKIQTQLDAENVALKQDADDFRNATIASFDRTGEIDNEGSYLGLLENDYQMDLSDGDVPSASQRQGEIDTQKRYLVSLSIQKQLDDKYSEWLGKQDITANQNYLDSLREIASLNNITISYKGVDGSNQSFVASGLQNYQMNFGDLRDKTLSSGMADKIDKFITDVYVPDYANKLVSDFNQQVDKVGSSYQGLKSIAQNSLQLWNNFASQNILVPFAELVNEKGLGKTGVQKSLLNGLFSAVQKEVSGFTVEDDATLNHLKEIRLMFPDVAGSDFQESINNFISRTYIPKFADKMKREFEALYNKAGTDYDTLKAKAIQLDKAWSTFASDPNVLPFQDQLNAEKTGTTGTLSYMLQGLIDSLSNKYSVGEYSGFKTLQEMNSLQQLLPSVSGVAFQGKYGGLEKDIATANFEKFYNQAQQDFAQTQGQQQEFTSALSFLNSLYQNGNIGYEEYQRLNQEIQKNITEFSTAWTNFSNQYGQNYFGSGTNYKQFLPYAEGKVRTPSYKTPKKSDIISQLLGIKDISKLPKVGFRIPAPEFLSLFKPNQYFKSQFGNEIYAKAGVEQPWGEKIPNVVTLQKYSPDETLKIGSSYYLKPGVERRW